MNTRISKDFERLSAYIDNQLSPAEKAELEARLLKEAELQATLNDLRRTVGALRTLPAIKPPRSFTLTAEQVGAGARRGPLFPFFRLAAALCALLLTLAVARDFATSGLAASASRDGTTQSAGVTPLSVPNAAAPVTPSPQSSAEAYGAGAPAPTVGASADTGVTPLAHLAPTLPSATPAAGAQVASASASATADATVKNLPPTETPADTAVSVAVLPPNATQNPVPNAAPQPSAQAPPSDLRVVEIVLAALALGLAAAAWFTRRG